MSLHYISAAHDWFDVFLNDLFGKSKNFSLHLAERNNPRPEKLHDESLAMYNFSMPVYFCSDGFDLYDYRSEIHHDPKAPDKEYLEEWLDADIPGGKFQLHLDGYKLTTTFTFNNR